MCTSRPPIPGQPSLTWEDVADGYLDVIVDLARDGKADTRRDLAAHQGTPSDVLGRLTHDRVVRVAAAALSNPLTPERALREAWSSAKNGEARRSFDLAEGLMSNPNVPPDVYREAEAVVQKGIPRIFDPDTV